MARITWRDSRAGGEIGEAGGFRLFTITWLGGAAPWRLYTELPIGGPVFRDRYESLDECKRRAERALDVFLRRVSEATAEEETHHG